MTSQVPPNPILTTYQYWNWLNIDAETRRQRALDNTYMMFPTVQNNPTSFSKMFVNLISLITQIANTSYVFDKINDLLFYANTWTGLNTFDSIDTNSITTNTITATTLALSGTQLDTPLTPFYTNLPVFYVANATSVTYGTKVGAVGQIIYSAANNTIFPSTANSTLTVTLSVGTWLLSAEIFINNIFSDRVFFGFNTVANSDVGMFCGYGPTSGLNAGTIPGGLRLNTIYTVTSGTPTIYLMFRGYNFGVAASNRVFTATRLA